MPSFILAQLDYWQLTLDGGVTNLFIFLLSVIAAATAIESWVSLRGDRIVSKELIADVRKRWRDGSATELELTCAKRGGTFSNLAAFLSRNRSLHYDALSVAVSDLASLDIRRHVQRVYPLALVATLAPLAGLFGTVLGMVETFHTVAETGSAANIGLLASGIYRALSTTAAGLLVAIPTLGLYHYFRMRIRSASLLLEEGMNELLNEHVLRREPSDARS